MQDVEIRCGNGSLLHNRLLVGLVFPELELCREYQLGLAPVILIPQLSLLEVFHKFQIFLEDPTQEQDQDVRRQPAGEEDLPPTMVAQKEVKAKETTRVRELKQLRPEDETKMRDEEQKVKRVGERSGDGEGGFSCPTCGKWFQYRGKLVSHINTHSKPFACGVCAETFAEESKLASHELNSHGAQVNSCSSQVNRCEHCSKVFPAPSQLALHRRTHTKEKPFQCSQCQKRFSAKCNLTAHERIHFGESRRYECRFPPCDRRFSHTSERKDHETSHTGARPHLCPHCGARYKRNANLWRHKQKCEGRARGTKYEIVIVDCEKDRQEEEEEEVITEQVITSDQVVGEEEIISEQIVETVVTT